MRTRESGMPDAELWESFFDVERILDGLRLTPGIDSVVEFGCGYGTFTLPTACRVRQVHAIDIDPQMVAGTKLRAHECGVTNISVEMRDFDSAGSGLASFSTDYTMLFNILHAELPLVLLNEAHRVLKPGGLLGIMHWNYDPKTPRGPSMAIRPKPEQCAAWAIDAGFQPVSEQINLPPYHYGFVFARARSSTGGQA
ncbi:MAG: class I SAM-dependent methyltransferase [Planctomycetes bacterium]|nr:class I SAM-dependent methyltransferase [Planctomycetota bacterium]